MSSSAIDMTRRCRISTEPWKVRRIVGRYTPPDEKTGTGNNNALRLPEGQRLWSWKDKRGQAKQVNLVDSVFYNYPIPSIILNETEDGVYFIYDGRHRVETLWNFKKDKFTWNGKKYSELSEDDRERFDEREIPVLVVQHATVEQLADMFMRLNAGMPLKDKDFCWARRDSPLISKTREIVRANARFKPLFGGIDIESRDYLPNWIALVLGLSTGIPGNMTTSFLRVSEHLEHTVDEAKVSNGLDALYSLYTTANQRYPMMAKDLKRYKKIGFVSAFFLADWMTNAEAARPAIVEKWIGLIGKIRSNEDNEKCLRTTGAQNLTTKKIEAVLRQVNEFLAAGTTAVVTPSDESSVDEDTDEE